MRLDWTGHNGPGKMVRSDQCAIIDRDRGVVRRVDRVDHSGHDRLEDPHHAAIGTDVERHQVAGGMPRPPRREAMRCPRSIR